MRKVLSLVLVLALVLGSFSMAFAATPTDVVGAPSEEAVTVLMGLGVVDGYADGTFKPAGIVTRAEMAKLIVVALGLKDYAVGTSKYPDMAGATWAQGYVNYATALGVIEGYPDGTFGPSKTVTYDEAAAMIVRALGYTDDSLTGTWPANYVLKARALGILDGIKSVVGGANRGDIAQMLYNALDLEIGYVDKEGVWNGYDDNMLDRLGAELIDADTTDGGIIYGDEDTMINLRAYVGAYADRYVNSDDEIIMVNPVSEFLVGEWDGDTFVTEDDKEYTLATGVGSEVIPYFHNGGYEYEGHYGSISFNLDDVSSATPATVAVETSGSKIKTIYSYQQWNGPADGIFDATDAKDITKDQELFSEAFLLDDNDAIDLDAFVLMGAATLSDIKVDNVVYVYSDPDNMGGTDPVIRKIAVGTETVSGSITKISSGGDVTIGGKVYSFADESEYTSEDFSAGDSVDVKLDYFGNIYDIEITESATNFAIALDSANGNPGLGGDDPLLQLYLADGTDKVFVAATDESVYGLNDTTYDWDYAPTPGAIYEYGVDKDGVVDTLTFSDAEYMYDEPITAKGYYYGYAFATDAVIWTYDNTFMDMSDPDAYDTTTLANVKDTDDVEAYYVLDGGKIVAMLIVSSITSNDTYGVVTDWASTDTDAGYTIDFLIDGVAKTYVATDAAYDNFMDLGMYNELYLLSFNAAGEVVALAVADDSAYYDTYMEYPTVDGDVVSADGYDDLTLDAEVVVYVWNATDEVFEVGDVNDIDDSEDVYLYDVADDDYVIDIVLVDVNGDMVW